MCLGILGKVVDVLDGYAGQMALVDVEGARRKINIGMRDDPPAPETWGLIDTDSVLETVEEVAVAGATNSLEMVGRERNV